MGYAQNLGEIISWTRSVEHTNKVRVNKIHAITILVIWRYTITIHLFTTVPLHFTLCLKCAITYPFNTFLKIFGQNYPHLLPLPCSTLSWQAAKNSLKQASPSGQELSYPHLPQLSAPSSTSSCPSQSTLLMDLKFPNQPWPPPLPWPLHRPNLQATPHLNPITPTNNSRTIWDPSQTPSLRTPTTAPLRFHEFPASRVPTHAQALLNIMLLLSVHGEASVEFKTLLSFIPSLPTLFQAFLVRIPPRVWVW